MSEGRGVPGILANAAEVLVPASAMARPSVPSSDQYSVIVCSVFMLNMVLGTGPMTLPYAFNQAGLVLSLVLLLVFMALSYITTTFIVESLALANGLKHHGYGKRVGGDAGEESFDEDARELHLQNGEEIVERLELGASAEVVLPPCLVNLVYFALIAYTYGVLIVYAVSANLSVAKELPVLTLGGSTIQPYNYCLAIFMCIVSPLCLLNFARTRPLQVVVGFLRITVILLMVFAMSRFLYYDEGSSRGDDDVRKLDDIPMWNTDGLPDLFGNAAFTFMIHHSIPGLVVPLRKHKQAPVAIGIAFAGACVLYVTLGFLAMWSFGDETWWSCPNTPDHPCRIQDLFNMNFSSDDWGWAAIFIVCYPVLIVSIFPLVAITLRNNLRALFVRCGAVAPPPSNGQADWRNYMFTLMTICPPFAIAFVTQDVQSVLKYIGGYAGLILMFLVPTLLLHYARIRAGAHAARCTVKSPFGSVFVQGTIMVFFIGCTIFNTYKLIFD